MELKNIEIKLNTTEKIKRFISVVRSFSSDVDVLRDRACVDGKSVLGLYALDLSKCVFVRIISDDITERRNFEAAMEEFR